MQATVTTDIKEVNCLDRTIARGWSYVRKRDWPLARNHANVAIGIANRLYPPMAGSPPHPQLKRARKLCKHLGIRQ